MVLQGRRITPIPNYHKSTVHFFDREKPSGAERATKGSGYPTQGILPSRQNVCKLHPFSNPLNFADADAVADADAGEYYHRSKMSAMFNHFPNDPHILFFFTKMFPLEKSEL